jgi:hypothetical protein
MKLDQNEVDENFQDLDEAARRLKYKTEKQINLRVSNLLHQEHCPLICPENTRKYYFPGLVGEETSHQGEKRKVANTRNNAINGPIKNARIKEENRIARDEYFRTKFPDQIELLVTPEQVEVH